MAYLIGTIVGLILGFPLIWLIFKLKGQQEKAVLEERLNSRDQQFEELNNSHKKLETDFSEVSQALGTTSAQLAAAEEKNKNILRLEDELREKNKFIETLNDKSTALNIELSELKTILSKERKQNEEKFELLNEARENLKNEFKALAGEILESNSKKFTEQNKSHLEMVLNPLGEKIKVFENKVGETYEKSAKERAGLKELVKNLQDMNRKLSEDAINLTKALKGETKTQGNWGELVLERILEASGLQKGRDYLPQENLFSREDSRRYQPDVIINLPDDKSLIVDSKVSLTAYEKYCSSENKEEKSKALKEHLDSINKHVKELSTKNYQEIKQIKTLDFVMMFMPIETAFSVAVQEDPELYIRAFDKRIVIVTPSTLLATLRTIAYIWRREDQQNNAEEIARQAGKLYDKLVGFVENIESIRMRLDQSRNSVDEAMKKLCDGRGNIIGRAEKIRELGASPGKRIPASMVEKTLK